MLQLKLKDFNSKYSGAVKFFCYWAILLFVSMPHGTATKIVYAYNPDGSPQFILPTTTAAQILNTFGHGDMASYCRMATHFAAGTFVDFDYWHMRLFPPGLTLLEAGILKTFGSECPIILCLAIVTCATWAFAMYKFSTIANQKVSGIFAALIPLSLLLSGIFVNYFMRAGLFMTESLSTAELCLSFMFLLSAVRLNKKSSAALAGLFLGLAAYTRGQNEFVGFFLTTLVIIFVGSFACLFIKKIFQRGKLINKSSVAKLFARVLFYKHRGLGMLFIAMLFFTGVTLPYRICNKVLYNSFSWMQADRYFEANWRKDSELTPGFVAEGITVAAKVNPELASRIQAQVKIHGISAYPDAFYKMRSITTFLRHPVKWMKLKFPIIETYWFEDNYKHLMHGRLAQVAIYENWFYLCLMVYCSVRFVLIPLLQWRPSSESLLYFSYYSILIFLTAAVSILYTCEERYFYTMKISTCVLLALYLVSGQTRPKIVQADSQKKK